MRRQLRRSGARKGDMITVSPFAFEEDEPQATTCAELARDLLLDTSGVGRGHVRPDPLPIPNGLLQFG